MSQKTPNYDNNYILSQTQVPQSLLVNQHPAQTQEVTLQDLYYMPDNFEKKKGFKDVIKKFDLFRIVTPWFEHPLMTLGAYVGIGLGVDAFDKSCNKEYEKSIVGKAAKLGDNIHDSKFMKSGFGKGLKKVKGACSNAFNKLVEKSAILRSMIQTPSVPEFSAPKEELKPMEDRLVNMFREMAQETNLINTKKGPFKLADLALDKNEVEQLKKAFNVKKLSEVDGDKLASRVMLQRLKKSEDEIVDILKQHNARELVSAELRKASGLTEAELMGIMDGTASNASELAKKASKNLKDIRVNKGNMKLPGRFQLFTNKTSFSEIFNRLHSISDGATTSTGKLFAKMVQKIHRGFTFGGAKMGVMLFLASVIVETINNAIKADPKEKIGTIAQGILGFGTWVFTFPLVLAGIHAFGGVQYAGMSKENVAEYRNAIEEFNLKAKSREFKSFKDYSNAKKSLTKTLKKLRGRETVGDQNLITKILRGISRFTKKDLLKIEHYRNESALGNTIRKIPNFTKDAIYSPLRFVMFMMVGIPLVDKLIDKCIHLIFGKSYDMFKEEEKVELKKQQEEFTVKDLKNRMLEIQHNKIYNPEIFLEQNENRAFEMLKTANDENQLPGEFTHPLPTEKINNSITVNNQIETDDFAEHLNETFEVVPDNENIEKQSDKILPVLENDSNISQTEEVQSLSSEAENLKLDNYEYIPNSENLIKQDEVLQENVDNYTYIPNSTNTLKAEKIKGDSYNYIPSDKNLINDNPVGKKRYIPAQTPANIVKEFDNSALDDILKKADRAEQKAINVLAGKFDGMY